ncbi:MAG TPA: 3',5'-cyclic-nucleotide phosphodiesterase [bacterium]|nr:3',5'-cyclic-nucleotide phosphodiesterase [bacterium]
MKVRVLGCYGGELPGYRTTCFLVNNNVMIDAGAATAALPLKDQVKIDAILLTHSHLDHVRDLGFLADNVFGKREGPVRVWALPETIRSVKAHILNNTIWPDFTQLPDAEHPVMSFHELREGIPVEVEGLAVTAIKVNHLVPAAGYIVKNQTAGFAFSGDTGPTEALWKAAAAVDALRAVFLELSLPDRLAELAELTRHLTPASALKELIKLNRPDLPVYFFHMKPQYLKEIVNEVDSDPRFHVTEQGDHIEI